MPKPKVLILCTGNSCRSHLAEGILRAAAGDLFEVFSAGSKPKGEVHPLALEALKEAAALEEESRLMMAAETPADYVDESCALCTEAFADTPEWPLRRTPCNHGARRGSSYQSHVVLPIPCGATNPVWC